MSAGCPHLRRFLCVPFQIEGHLAMLIILRPDKRFSFVLMMCNFSFAGRPIRNHNYVVNGLDVMQVCKYKFQTDD